MVTITIVGLPKKYSNTEIENMLTVQNDFVKEFSQVNNMKDHFKVIAIRPLKNNPSLYQIFANVSTILREGFNHYNDKITLGLNSCKIYDRYHVKRCYNSQKFGHYAKDCPNSDVPCCGKCGDAHCTNDCTSNMKRCVNCTYEGNADSSHYTFDLKCPVLIKQQKLLKDKLDKTNLNMDRHKRNLNT